MPATSTVPTAKAAAVTGLAGAAGLTAVQVSYGHPGRDMEREFLYVGGTVDWDQEWASIGNHTREERYTLALWVYVHKPDGSQQETTERAFALLAAAETWLRANTTLTNTVMIGDIALAGFDEAEADEGRATVIEAGIRCLARLS